MRGNVVKNPLLMCPTEEVHLPDGCQEIVYALTLEDDAVVATEGVKQLLAVCLGLTLIVQVHEEFLAVQHIRGVVLLGVVGDEDVNQAEAVFPITLHRIHELLENGLVLDPVVVFDETHDKEFPPTWDVLTTGLVETIAIRLEDVGLGISAIASVKRILFFVCIVISKQNVRIGC